MRNAVKVKVVLILLLAVFLSIGAKAQVSVKENGQLSVNGIYLVNENGDPVQLKGMSLFWSQWMGQFFNAGAIRWLRKDWKCDVVRAAMGVEKGGYLAHPEEEKEKVEIVLKASIKKDMYVIIDYHSHEAHHDVESAKKFFGEMAKKYGKYPNVLYEIYNEPLGGHDSWKEDIKPYAEEVIKAIREHDPDNVIIVGTPQWSQLVDAAAESPVADKNVAYTLHFYATTHRQELRDIAQKAIDQGICLFVTEFGTCPASGDGKLDFEETQRWFDFLDKYHISWCNWSVSDKNESASIVKKGAAEWGNWKPEELTESGVWIRDQIRKGKE